MTCDRAARPPEVRRRMVDLVRCGRTSEALSREFEPSAASIAGWVRRAARAAQIEALVLDRTMARWHDVFERAGLLLRGLFPDVRAGGADGSAPVFDMERLFERVLGRRVLKSCAADRGRLRVGLQGPSKNLSDIDFRLKPDITVSDRAGVVAIVDAKWKTLDPDGSNGGVSSADAYRLNAYADRYGCTRLAHVYPASGRCPPGLARTLRLLTPRRPTLHVVTIALDAFARAKGVPEPLRSLVLREAR